MKLEMKLEIRKKEGLVQQTRIRPVAGLALGKLAKSGSPARDYDRRLLPNPFCRAYRINSAFVLRFNFFLTLCR